MIELKQIGQNANIANIENWYIVRKLDDNIRSHTFVYVPELAPSPELFSVYKELRDSNNWNSVTFRNQYLPVFLREMTSQTANEKLMYLVNESRKRDIALFCYCKDEALCHRSIVGGILKGLGADISCNEEYLRYYQMYKSLFHNAQTTVFSV